MSQTPGAGSAGRVVVAGALARRLDQGGHVWFLLQYVRGLQRLGWDVVVVDRVDPGSDDAARAAGALLDGLGLAGRWAVLVDGTDRSAGLSRRALGRLLDGADLLIDVMGYLDDPALADRCRTRVFLDCDPGFPQLWDELGWASLLEGHDVFVTVGTNIGGPDCTVPTRGRRWIPTLPPVLLEAWPALPPAPGRVSTVASWRGPFGPIERDGERLGLRVHGFRPLVGVAGWSPWPVELALAIDPWDGDDLAGLHAAGWRTVDPREVAATPDAYRRYVQGSSAELSVAKELYVATRSGWFSDRSACYLASGRPVVTQDTGCTLLPSGAGLCTFDDADGAVAALEAVADDLAGHSRAARALAEEHLDSDRVLGRLVAEAAAVAA